MRDKLLKTGFRLRIVQNLSGSIFRPNDEYWKWLHAKIVKGALPQGRDISVREKLLEKGCRLRIVRNRMGSIFRPNNKYWK